MGYVGVKPSAVPLTSADITDGIITSAKIVDGTIVNADINASAAIASTKLSGVTSDYVLLATTDVSTAVASVSFDGYFLSTYKNYQILISDIYPSTTARLYCRFRRSNADVTASSYSYAARRTHLASTNVSDGRYGAGDAFFDVLTNQSPNSASRTTGSKIIIYNPLSTTSYKKVNFQSVGASDDGGGTNAIWNVNSFGQLVDNTDALSGITFYYSSGNINSGNFKLYGIK